MARSLCSGSTLISLTITRNMGAIDTVLSTRQCVPLTGEMNGGGVGGEAKPVYWQDN